MEGATPEEVQEAADQIVRLINGRVKKNLSTIYALVQIASRSLASASGLDEDTVITQLSGVIRHALSDKTPAPRNREAVRKLKEWEVAQLNHWNKLGVPQC